MLTPDTVKQSLLTLEEPQTEFTVVFSGKKSKKVNGLYKSESREIIIQNRNFLGENGMNENSLMYTAVHEYAHHIHSERRGGKLPPRAHGPDFWAIFHNLLEKAESRGLYHTGVDDSPELSKVTTQIREKYLTQNGLMFKEFGGLLIKAAELCAAIGLRFEDYLDRVLCIPKNAAKLAVKSFEYDINPSIGVDNMRYVAGIRPEESRRAAEKSFLLGKSPSVVKTSLKGPSGPSDPRLSLEKEKERLERTIASLQKRLHEIEHELKDDNNTAEFFPARQRL
ncbi:MAG: hypothetical protein LBG74_07655 [Spirochaetaceae bacterium]|jgi:hypothetical protein|nr:hypothetical protein [Spirochaetaceae bacterium]